MQVAKAEKLCSELSVNSLYGDMVLNHMLRAVIFPMWKGRYSDSDRLSKIDTWRLQDRLHIMTPTDQDYRSDFDEVLKAGREVIFSISNYLSERQRLLITYMIDTYREKQRDSLRSILCNDAIECIFGFLPDEPKRAIGEESPILMNSYFSHMSKRSKAATSATGIVHGITCKEMTNFNETAANILTDIAIHNYRQERRKEYINPMYLHASPFTSITT